MANADRLQARHAPVAVDLLERALGDITAHKHIEERAKELSDIATRFSKLLGVEPLASRYGALFKPKALAALQHEAKRARAKAEHDCAVNRLLEDAQVQRPEDDAESVRKKARRYRKNAATRLVFVGEGDDFPELEHGFEVVRTIEAVLRHQSILDELEIRLMDIRALTADLPHLKKLRCAPEEYPDLLGELERLELVECRSRFWDGGFPGLSGFWVKVYINALVYESLIGELWTLHAWLCNLIRCRLEEKPVKDV